MKYSEAIRLGAMMSPGQAYGELRDSNGNTCARGAAMDAIGILDGWIRGRDITAFQKMESQFPIEKAPASCPLCKGSWAYPYDVITAVVHLNNEHKWTRQQIADWVETKERELEQAAEPELVTVAARE